MKKNTGLVIGLVFAGLLVLAGVSVFAFDRTKASDSNSSSSEVAKSTTKEFDSASIADLDGKNGKKCYVAVDGKVYDMSNFSLWRNGVHTNSSGQATCGKDLSSVINKASHGKSKLKIMPQVGIFK